MWVRVVVLKDVVDVVVLDGDLIGVGDECLVFLYYGDGVRDFICWVVVVIVYVEDVFVVCQFVEYVVFFVQWQFFWVMDVVDVKGFWCVIGQVVDDVLMVLWGIVEDDEFVVVCWVILIVVYIEQVWQECVVVSGWCDDVDKWFFVVGVECFDDGWCWYGVWVS